MYKIRIITIGKIKEKWLKLAIEREKSFICLDEKGVLLNSENFSKKVLTVGSKISFLIGGDMGISKNIQKRALFVLSLSKLTFTHQMTRLILLEQLYRSFEIERGSPYHK
jgi:23S rRNA (pseudouridine1915-N3)-methyltransferase